jgi:hypothetical protein
VTTVEASPVSRKRGRNVFAFLSGPAAPLLESKEADAPGARLLNDCGPIEDNHFAGLERGSAEMGFTHRFQRALAKARNVESPVLPRFYGLHEQRFVGLECGGATQHFVGAFERFNGKDRTFSYDAPLTDIESRAFSSDVNPVINVVAFDRK